MWIPSPVRLLTLWCLALPFWPAPAARAAERADRLAGVRNYVVYYGAVADADVERLSRHDLVVIDPQAVGGDAKAKIAAIKRGGARVFGYLSYFEVAEWHRYRDRVDPDWLLEVDGRPWRPWGDNRAADLSVPAWRSLLVALTRTEVLDYGCDGVFMDTLADLDHPGLPPELRTRQLEGLDALLRALRREYPELPLFANWTLQATLPVVAPHVDAVCWENFQPAFFEPGNEAETFMEGIAARLAELRRGHGFRVAALWASSTADPARQRAEREAMARRAEAMGYWWYYCVGDYHHDFWRDGP